MSLASRTSQIAPETAATTRLAYQPRPAAAQAANARIEHLVCGSEGRRGHYDLKNHHAGGDDCGGEMNGAEVRKRIAQLTATDAEGEASFRFMGIDRQRLPAHPVGALRKRFQTDPHGVAADLRLTLIDARAVGTRHLDRTESGLEVLREGQRDFARRARHGAADEWAGMIEERMGMRDGDGHRE